MTIALAVSAAFALALAVGMSLASRLLGPAGSMEGDKGMPYETGMPPMAAHPGLMRPAFFRYAVLFVVFDVDLAFLAPWALARRGLDLEAAASITVFLLLVGFTLAYVWKKGALRCD